VQIAMGLGYTGPGANTAVGGSEAKSSATLEAATQALERVNQPQAIPPEEPSEEDDAGKETADDHEGFWDELFGEDAEDDNMAVPAREVHKTKACSYVSFTHTSLPKHFMHSTHIRYSIQRNPRPRPKHAHHALPVSQPPQFTQHNMPVRGTHGTCLMFRARREILYIVAYLFHHRAHTPHPTFPFRAEKAKRTLQAGCASNKAHAGKRRRHA
jgi:hypothetical protein